ncbi:MAG: hypothetical protein CEN90_297 [Parcubacteria group bacterium Licking1014_17]|nr:MAG: hypothetical protein CEN90_297 [Parcubacteria group bacterium Licking1014_17]
MKNEIGFKNSSQADKALEFIVKWGLYSVALIPLVIFREFLSPFHFGKVVVFRTMIEILGVLYLALILKNRRYLPPRTAVFWVVTLFTLVFGITTLTSFDFYPSFMGTFERMGGWFTFAHFWLFFVMAIGMFKTREDWYRLINISLVASLLSAFYGFLQRTTDLNFVLGSGGRSRIFGTLGNPALFAGYEIVNIFFALAMLLRRQVGTLPRLFYGFVFFIGLISVAMTAVRGSILAVVVAFLVFLFLYARIGGNRIIKWGLGSALAVAILFEVLLILNHNNWAFIKNSGFFSRISDVSFNVRTVNTRFWAWQAGIEGWSDSAKTVILGWGPENFNAPFSKHFNPKFFTGSGAETLFDRAHNMFVEVLVTMGIIGFAAYILMFVVLFKVLSKLKQSLDGDDKIISCALVSGLIAYLIHNQFIFDTSANYVVFFIFAGFVAFFSLKPKNENTPEVKPLEIFGAGARYSLVIIAAIVVIFSIYFTNITPAVANYTTTRAIVASWPQTNNQPLAIKRYKVALTYDTFGSYEIRHRFANYLLENFSKIPASEKPDELFLYGIEQVKKNLVRKNDILPYLYISRLYIILGRNDPKSPYNDMALQYSLKAKGMIPNFVRTYYEIAQAYVNKNDYPSALKIFKESIDLNPDTGLSWWYYGLAQLESGNEQGGIQSLNTAISDSIESPYDPNESDYIRLINYFVDKKNYQKLLESYQGLVRAKPNIGEYHFRLALLYANFRMINEATAEAEKAKALDPKLTSDVDSLLSRLEQAR